MRVHESTAVIWDMDGTLVDTGELHYQAWVELARELNKPFTREDFSATFGWRNPEIIPRIFGNNYSECEIQELGDRKENLYREKARLGVDLLPGAASLLAQLHHAGIKQAIASSAPRRNLDLILDVTGTQEYFTAIVSMEDTQRGKPDPQVFLMAASRLAAAPNRCLVVEDAPVGVQGAKSGGMRCIAVTFAGHHDVASLRAAGADLIVPSLEDVTVERIRSIVG
jgi:beta-phosphoglucomutase